MAQQRGERHFRRQLGSACADEQHRNARAIWPDVDVFHLHRGAALRPKAERRVQRIAKIPPPLGIVSHPPTLRNLGTASDKRTSRPSIVFCMRSICACQIAFALLRRGHAIGDEPFDLRENQIRNLLLTRHAE